MKTIILILLCLPALLRAQPFQWRQELDSIKVEVDGYEVPVPWLGGYWKTSPDLCDIDGDGDFDIILGNATGNCDFYENYGSSTNPLFRLSEQNFQNLNGYAEAVFDFVDIDSDGDLDAFVDGGDIPMKYYRNIGNSTVPQFILEIDTLRDCNGNYIDGTDFSLCDLDADGDYDLFVGVWYTGTIKYYENIGDSTQFTFDLITENFAGILTSSWSSPTFCDLDSDGDYDLFIGMNGGGIMYYRNDGTPQQCNYTYVSNQWLGINIGEQASPDFCDIDADGDYDLFIGKNNDASHTVPGALHFWSNQGTPQNPQLVQESQMYLTLDFGTISEPGLLDINFDGKEDLLVHTDYIGWMKNIGTESQPRYQIQSYNIAGEELLAASVGYGDLNGDGNADFGVGFGWTGRVQFFLNDGDTVSPEFNYLTSMDVGDMCGTPFLVDMDGDGDNDMIISVSTYNFVDSLKYYENTGNPHNFIFTQRTNNYQGWAGTYVPVCILDFDGDGDYDVIETVDFYTLLFA